MPDPDVLTLPTADARDADAAAAALYAVRDALERASGWGGEGAGGAAADASATGDGATGASASADASATGDGVTGASATGGAGAAGDGATGASSTGAGATGAGATWARAPGVARPLLLVGDADGFLLDGALREPALRELLAQTCELLAAHPQPVLAAAPGALLDAGLELALACDLRFAAPGSTAGLPGAIEGRLPVGGGQRLAHLAGSSLATRMLLLGELVACGDEPALARALTVCDDPVATACAALARVRESAPLAVEGLKVALRAASESSLAAGLEIEADVASLLLPTADRAEGIAASRARRRPEFHGA